MSGNESVIGGGLLNTVSSNCSAILGGANNNTCNFQCSMVVGNDICVNRGRTTFVNKLSATDFDECASVGSLPSGSFYYDSATCIVLFKH